MSLKNAFAKVHKSGGQFYLKLAQYFEENQLIRETWAAMAQDLEQQQTSLEELSPRFWKVIKSDEEALLSALRECSAIHLLDNKEDIALHRCYSRCLDIEEPLILRTYVPLIRLLRTEWSDRALDFYIMVKSHMARISRIIQPFSVDPVLLQRVQNLQQRFEFEVQNPLIRKVSLRESEGRRHKKAHRKLVAVVKPERKLRSAASKAKPASRLGEHVKSISKRAKPLVRKIEIAPRRARR